MVFEAITSSLAAAGLVSMLTKLVLSLGIGFSAAYLLFYRTRLKSQDSSLRAVMTLLTGVLVGLVVYQLVYLFVPGI